MKEVRKGSITIRINEIIPLKAFDKPKRYLVSYQIVDGTKKLPPAHVVIEEGTDLRKFFEKEIEVYLEFKHAVENWFE